MKKRLKFLLLILAVASIVTVYFYLKPAIKVKQLSVEADIPIKIGHNFSKNDTDSVVIYLPYKFQVSNNRLKKIKFGIVMFNNKYFNDGGNDMYFDKNGYLLGRSFNHENLDKLLAEKKYFKYLQLYYNDEIFPFSDEEYYFYKPFLVKKSSIVGLTEANHHAFAVKDFLRYQTKNLYHKSKLKVKKEIIDSLYQSDYNEKILLSYDTENDGDFSDGYEIVYYLYTDKQSLIDNSEMTPEELEKFLLSNPFEN